MVVHKKLNSLALSDYTTPMARNLDNLFHLLEDSVKILLKLLQFFAQLSPYCPSVDLVQATVQFPQSAASPICAGLHYTENTKEKYKHKYKCKCYSKYNKLCEPHADSMF